MVAAPVEVADKVDANEKVSDADAESGGATNDFYKDILVEAKTGSKRKLIDYRGAEPKPYNTKKIPGNVWYYSRVRYRMSEYEKHPSQKPEALLERIILASSN